MKRLLKLLLIGTLCMLLSACGAKEELNDTRINMPSASSDYEGINYLDVISELENAGFTNIKAEVLDDLILGLFTKDGEVENVSVDGDSSFSVDSKYEKDVEIIVSYHSFPIDEEVEDSAHVEEAVKSEVEFQEIKENDENEITELSIPSEEVTPEETPTSVYTFTDLNKTMYAAQVVNVRSIPSTDGEKLGSLTKAQEVTVTGQCNENAWYKIDYKGSEAFVSNKYITDEKPVIKTVSSEKSNSSGESSQSSGNSVTVPRQEEAGGNLVWVPTNGGKKYHRKSSCSKMKDPIQVSVDTAIANGYTPCKKCY